MDDEILEVLKQIRDEAKETNVRLASVEGRVEETNARLASVEGRVDFLEKRTSKGFESLNQRLETHVERIELLARQQAESEIRLTTEVVSLADVTREVRDLLARKIDDHDAVVDHKQRIRTLEHQIADRGKQ